MAFTRAKDRLFLSDAAGTNYDGSFRYPSRFLFNAEQENLDYVQPLPQELVEDARRAIERTEPGGWRLRPEGPQAGTAVSHPIFGPGKILAAEQGGAVYLVQFDRMVTPRSVKRELLTVG